MPHDKKLHTAAGFVIALVGSFLGGPAIGLCFAVIAGLGKELADEIVYGGFDIEDFWYTCAGGLLGAVLMGVMK